MHDLWRALAPHLGVRPGLTLAPRAADGRDGPPAILDPDGSGRRRYVLFHAVVEDGQPPHEALLRMQSAAGDARSAARRELLDLASSGLPARGTTRPDRFVAGRLESPVILPPVYFCREKGVWIGAVCPGCSRRPARLTELASGGDCPVCGSARSEPRPSEPGDASCAMEALWNGVQKSRQSGGREPQSADDSLPAPPCWSCERKSSCFPASGSPTHPKGAEQALLPVIPHAWAGAMVESFDVPLASWVRMLDGVDAEIALGESPVPGPVARKIDRTLGANRRLVPGDFARRAAGEALLLRLELLHQLLEGLRGVRAGLGHPHLDVRPSTIWVRAGEPGALTPAMWGAGVQLIDLAPGWHHAPGASRASMAPLGDMLPELVPPQGRPRVSVPGMMVARGETVEEEGQLGVRFLFLPEAGSSDVPEENERVTVAVVDEGRTQASFSARVEVAFKDVYRLVLFPGETPADDLDDALKAGRTSVRLGDTESSADPDLFAAGTIWISLLGRDAGDLVTAAKLRDAMTKAIEEEGIRHGDHVAAERACLRSGLAHDRLFGGWSAGDSSSTHPAAAEIRLVGRALWLGLRMCGGGPQLPGGGEPDSGDPAAALSHLLQEVEALRDEGRYIMLGRSPPEDEIFSVIRAFQAERTGS